MSIYFARSLSFFKFSVMACHHSFLWSKFEVIGEKFFHQQTKFYQQAKFYVKLSRIYFIMKCADGQKHSNTLEPPSTLIAKPLFSDTHRSWRMFYLQLILMTSLRAKEILSFDQSERCSVRVSSRETSSRADADSRLNGICQSQGSHEPQFICRKHCLRCRMRDEIDRLTVAFIDEDASESSFCAASRLRMLTNKLSKRAVEARWYKSLAYPKTVVSCCRIFKGQPGNKKLSGQSCFSFLLPK